MLLVSLPADTATPIGKPARFFNLGEELLLDEFELEIPEDELTLKRHCEIGLQGAFP